MIDLAGHQFEERDLIGRVMRNMKGPTRYWTPRWVVVKETFGVGSTVANAMCHAFDLNPDDELAKDKPALQEPAMSSVDRTQEDEGFSCAYPNCKCDGPADDDGCASKYTQEIGEAGNNYMARFPSAHPLPAQFRWQELWDVMVGASPLPLPDNASVGLLEALQEITEAGAEAWGEDRPCVKEARAVLAKATIGALNA